MEHLKSLVKILWALHNSLSEHNPLFRITKASGFSLEPFMHQADLFVRLACRRPIRALIADDVGLGKTIEALLLADYLMRRGEVKRALILVPRAILEQWRSELLRLGLRPVVVRGHQDLDKEGSVYLVKIDTAKRERLKKAVLNIGWDFIIIDECHKVGRVGSRETKRLSFVKQLLGKNPAAHVLMLSATPHRGKEDDYLERLRLIDPYLTKDEGLGRDFYMLARDSIVFRRTKEDVNEYYEMGEKIFTEARLALYLVEPTETEKKYYDGIDTLTRKILKDYYDKIKKGPVPIPLLIALIDKRALSSPEAGLKTLKTIIERRLHNLTEKKLGRDELREILEEGDEEEGEAVVGILAMYAEKYLDQYRDNVEEIIELAEAIRNDRDSRFAATLDIANHHVRLGENVVIFTEYRDTAEYIYRKLEDAGYRDIMRITGYDVQKDPNIIEKAKEWLSEGKGRILVSTDVAAEGLNLQAASVVINYEPPWSPLRLEQRIGRVWRLGQRRNVSAYVILLATEYEKVVFDILYLKLLSISNAQLKPKAPDELVVVNSAMEKLAYDLSKASLDISYATAFEEGVDEEEDLSAFSLWKAYKLGGRRALEKLVESLIAKMQRLRMQYREYGLERSMSYSIDKVLVSLAGVRSRRKLFEALGALLESLVRAHGGEYDRVGGILKHGMIYLRGVNDLASVLRAMDRVLDAFEKKRSSSSDLPLNIVCSGYDGEIHVFEVSVCSEGYEVAKLVVPIIEGRVSSLDVLFENLSRAFQAKCISVDGASFDEKTLLTKIQNTVADSLRSAYSQFIRYREDLSNRGLRDRDRWSPASRDSPNICGGGKTRRLFSIFGGMNISVVESLALSEDKKNVEEVAMKIAIEYERRSGRNPVNVSIDSTKHYDIYSEGKGEIRYIEVKGHSGSGVVAELTKEEFEVARKYGDKYWLYIVINIGRGEPILLTIKDPLNRMHIEPIERREIRYILKPRGG